MRIAANYGVFANNPAQIFTQIEDLLHAPNATGRKNCQRNSTQFERGTIMSERSLWVDMRRV